jgi:hypothetical protein
LKLALRKKFAIRLTLAEVLDKLEFTHKEGMGGTSRVIRLLFFSPHHQLWKNPSLRKSNYKNLVQHSDQILYGDASRGSV